jgi:uncharacterized OsmC-like protein
MDSDQFRSLQAPIKQKYRDEPDAARVTLRAEGRLAEGVSCRLETGRALVEAGLHPATGGAGGQAWSGDLLLQALAACTGVTLNAVATALGIVLRDACVKVEGDLDFRGTLGVSKDVPVGFLELRIALVLDTDASDEQLEKLVQLTERYCVVYQTLRQPPSLNVSRERP